MVMRRFDVWVGRIAAIVGIVYVLLASLWPLTASAGEEGTHEAASALHASIDRDEAMIGRLPLAAVLIDIRIGRVIAEIVARRDRGGTERATKTRRRCIACPALASDHDCSCDDVPSAALAPDSSTMPILLIPTAALALAAASALLGRGLRTA